MFWSETYSGGSISITIQASFNNILGRYTFSGIPLLKADVVEYRPRIQLLNTI
jgi:hypothetical protein